MWKTIVFSIPDWKIFVQAVVALIIPYMISRFFKWIRTAEDDS
nr:hypothetical protein [uncultured Bacillus sp.]